MALDAISPNQPDSITRLAFLELFNGTTWDGARANQDTGALVTLTGASASGQSPDQTNFNGRGLKVFINISALSGTTPTLTVSIQVKDTASGNYVTVLSSTALNAVAESVLTVYPGIGVTANVSASDLLTRTWRISYAIGGTTPSVTATIAASVIL